MPLSYLCGYHKTKQPVSSAYANTGNMEKKEATWTPENVRKIALGNPPDVVIHIVWTRSQQQEHFSVL